MKIAISILMMACLMFGACCAFHQENSQTCQAQTQLNSDAYHLSSIPDLSQQISLNSPELASIAQVLQAQLFELGTSSTLIHAFQNGNFYRLVFSNKKGSIYEVILQFDNARDNVEIWKKSKGWGFTAENIAVDQSAIYQSPQTSKPSQVSRSVQPSNSRSSVKNVKTNGVSTSSGTVQIGQVVQQQQPQPQQQQSQSTIIISSEPLPFFPTQKPYSSSTSSSSSTSTTSKSQPVYPASKPQYRPLKAVIHQVDHCLIYSNDGCIKCDFKYFLANGACIPIQPECSSYDKSTGVCIGCYNGYYLDSNSICQKANFLCQTSDQYGNCLTCYKDYHMTSNQRCVYNAKGDLPCSIDQENNPLCSKYSSGVCVSCTQGCYLNANSICHFPDPNCDDYDYTKEVCKICMQGYELSKTSATCVRIPKRY